MNDSIERCLQHIEGIRQIASNANLAYAARSRIGRLVLRLSGLVTSTVGVPMPDKPGKVALSSEYEARFGHLARAIVGRGAHGRAAGAGRIPA